MYHSLLVYSSAAPLPCKQRYNLPLSFPMTRAWSLLRAARADRNPLAVHSNYLEIVIRTRITSSSEPSVVSKTAPGRTVKTKTEVNNPRTDVRERGFV